MYVISRPTCHQAASGASEPIAIGVLFHIPWQKVTREQGTTIGVRYSFLTQPISLPAACALALCTAVVKWIYTGLRRGMRSPRAPLAYINRAMWTAFLSAHHALGQAWEIVKLNGILVRMAQAICEGPNGKYSTAEVDP